MANRLLDYSIDPNKLGQLNRFILQQGFREKLTALSSLNLSVTQKPTQGDINILDSLTSVSSTIEVIDDISRIRLDPQRGCEFSKKVVFGGYDESKLQFVTLEGIVNITSHVLVEVTASEFLPIGYVTVYFYTRSNDLLKKSEFVRYSKDPDSEANLDYAKDRNYLINECALDNSILFIDGPFIGGNISSYSIKMIEGLQEKNIFPIFFVKNSNSNLVTDNVNSLKNKYNSDLHWAYNFLRPGERTNFFIYTDKVNPNNTKLFCYIKPFDRTSPQRIEMHPDFYTLFNEYIDETFSLIYYLMLVQGDRSNPQIRPIAIAEKYAREMIKTVNFQSLLKNSSLIATINQERFGG